jgi:hypothetical protein
MTKFCADARFKSLKQSRCAKISHPKGEKEDSKNRLIGRVRPILKRWAVIMDQKTAFFIFIPAFRIRNMWPTPQAAEV